MGDGLWTRLGKIKCEVQTIPRKNKGLHDAVIPLRRHCNWRLQVTESKERERKKNMAGNEITGIA
jgi:hypothetical protein